MVATASATDTEGFIDHDQVLEQIQDRVLWLSMNMVHHANNVPAQPGTAARWADTRLRARPSPP